MKAESLLVVASILAVAAASVHADEGAQANIVRAAPDPNGVDLVTGGLYVSEPGFTAPGAGKLQLTIGRSERGNEMNSLNISLNSSEVVPEQLWPRLFNVSANGFSSRFWCDEYMNCDEYAPKKGATLERLGGFDPTGFIYTAGDGTRVNFPVAPGINWADLWATEVLYPSGEKLTIQIPTPTVQNPTFSRTVTSNLGYTISQVSSGSTETRRLYKGGTGGTLLNTITSTWEDVGPPGYGYTKRLTDDLGRITRIRYEGVVSPLCWFGDNNSMSIKWFDDASGSRTTVNYHRVGVPNTSPWGFYGTLVVSSIVRNGKTWAYSDESWTGYSMKKQITDPTGAIREVLSTSSGYIGPANSPDACSSGGHAYFGNVTSDKRPLGQTTTFGYYDMTNDVEASDYLSSATFPEGNKLNYEYDDRGNLTRTTNVPKAGGAGTVVYQASFPAACPNRKTCNQPTWTRDAAGAQTDFTYDPTHGGLLVKLEPADANGLRRKTWNEFEAHNSGNGTVYRLSAAHVCAVHASNLASFDCQTVKEQVKRLTYWEHTLLPLTETQTNGTNSVSATTNYGYDSWGRVTSSTDPTGVTLYTRYDVMGRKTWQVSSNGAGGWLASKTTYDVRDLITQVDGGTLPSATSTALQVKGTTVNTFDVDGNLTKKQFIDAVNGRLTVEQNSYDAMSRPVCAVKRMNPAAFDVTADACAPGSVGSFGPDRITKSFYDLDGRVTKTMQGVGVLNGGLGIPSIEMGYTPNGQVAWRKDGNGNQTSYSYDGYDRLYQANFPGGSFERTEYDLAGRLWRFTKRDGQWVTHGYDGTSRLTSSTFSNGEPTITKGYDGHGRATSFSSGGQVVTLVYDDPLGRMSSEIQPAGTVGFLYDLSGRRTRVTWPGGYWVDYDYNSSGALWRVRELGASTGLGLLATWTFDGVARPDTLTRGNGIVTAASRDAKDRLLSLSQQTASAAQIVQSGYAYSPSSQMMSRTFSVGAWSWTPTSAANVNYVPDALNRYTAVGGVSFSYDGRANLTYDGVRTYGYDFSNRLVSASGGGTPSATLAYDPRDRLYSVTSNGITTRFLYEGTRVIAEYDGSGNLLRRHIRGGRAELPLLTLEGGATAATSAPAPNNARWLIVDERGSVTGFVNAAGSLGVNTYGPYGEPAAANSGRFGFTGQIWLPELQLYHFKARMYNPRLGRFMQTDPLGYKDGMHMYAYAGNDPANSIDPSGLYCTGVGDQSVCTVTHIAIYTKDANGDKQRSFAPLTDGLKKQLSQGQLDGIKKLEVQVTDAYKTAQTAVKNDPNATLTLQGKGDIASQSVPATEVVEKLGGKNGEGGALLGFDENYEGGGTSVPAYAVKDNVFGEDKNVDVIAFTNLGLERTSDANQTTITTFHEALHHTEGGKIWYETRGNQQFHQESFDNAAKQLQKLGQP